MTVPKSKPGNGGFSARIRANQLMPLAPGRGIVGLTYKRITQGGFMRVIETKAFQYDELTDAAKQVARDWFKGIACQGSDWYESTYDDAKQAAKIIGLDIDKIYFSGFSSQGDGACFEGSYRYAPGAVKAIKAYAPQDVELHRIAKALQAEQRRNFYQLRASTKHRGHYYHAYCMAVSVEDVRDNYGNCSDDAESEITELLRDFANWIYKQLEKEYEYQTSDENAEEMILANEYEFDENGNRI